MQNNGFKTAIQNIISGNVIEEQSDTLYAIRNYLCASFATNTTHKKDFDNQQRIKKEQEKFIIQ
jgi:hypothetical protein